MNKLVEIVLPVPLPQAFSYRFATDIFTPDSSEQKGPDEKKLIDVGSLVEVSFGRRKKLVGLVVAVSDLEPGTEKVDGYALKDINKVLPAEYKLNAERLGLARWMAEYYALPLGEIVPLFHPPKPETSVRGKSKNKDESFPEEHKTGLVLTESQKTAVEAVDKHLAAGTFGAFLLHGVTGSGKTEVYLTVIERALALDRSSIFLLPEIALTPQTLARIKARFGDRVGAIHSGLSAGQRCLVHEQAARGEIQVVVGPRSALFAPLQNLGAIIVDEEHETSYKQDEKPRYNARHMAVVRARENQAVVVLGSATPDLESLTNAQAGRFKLLELPERIDAPMPLVEIVDMRGAQDLEGFTPMLVDAIQETLSAGRQIILYYNRRGFARVLQCADCGEIIECPDCDIGLTYHLRPRRLLCHYCGFTRPVPGECPECQSEEFLPSGGGTEKVEINLQANFPEARLLRLDHDTTRRRGSYQKILSSFGRREADILIGTQMVAKGHHFPGVALVGVLAADHGLSMPDFRASERSFQLLTQVAGRAGRVDAGRVIFQTYKPDDPVILAAAGHDYSAFLEMELPMRKALGYPPFRRLVRLGLSGRRLAETEAAASQLADVVRKNLADSSISVLGPAPAVFPRLQDRYRYQIIIKGTLTRGQKAWLADCLRGLKDSYRTVDVLHDLDPVSIY